MMQTALTRPILTRLLMARSVFARPVLARSLMPPTAPTPRPLACRARLLARLSGPAFSVRGLMLAALLLLAAASALAADAGTQLARLPDTPIAPAFELTGADGKVYRLADFEGKPLIVNFWATWCPPCRAEMPSMQRAWEQVEAEGIGMIAINVGEDAETVQAFLEQVPVSFPLPLDTDSKVSQRWPMRGLPTTFVVSPEGRLVYKATGEREWDNPALLDQVRALKVE